MDVRIGVTYSPKEIDVEMADATDREQLKEDIEQALAGGTVLWLTDRHGRQVAVPAEKIAYIELGSPDSERRIGFSTA